MREIRTVSFLFLLSVMVNINPGRSAENEPQSKIPSPKQIKTFSIKNNSGEILTPPGFMLFPGGGEHLENQHVTDRPSPYFFRFDVNAAHSLEKTSWVSDIPVLFSENIEKNPDLLSLLHGSSQAEMVLAAESWDSLLSYSTIQIRKSNDFGQSWSDSATVVLSETQYPLRYPRMAVVSDSSFGLVFQNSWTDQDNDIYLAVLKNDLTATEMIPIDNTYLNHLRPAIAGDAVDHPADPYIYLVYYQYDSSQSDLIFRKSTDFGNSWSYSQLSTFDSPDSPFCSIAGFGDSLVIAFTYKSVNNDDIALMLSTDRGETWEFIGYVANENQQERFPRVTFVNGNYLFLAYEFWYSNTDRDVYYAYSEDGGTNWVSNNALSVTAQDERFPVIRGFRDEGDVYAAFANLTTREILHAQTKYYVPTLWSDVQNCKDSPDTLTADSPPAMITGYSRTGEPGLAIAWSEKNNHNGDVFEDALWLPNDLLISGFVFSSSGEGVPGVVMNGLPSTPASDSTGYYAGFVPVNWSGTVQPQKDNLQFTPVSISYSGITDDQIDQNYRESAKPLPVELASFSANINGGNVVLSWQTVSESNFYGFEIERTSAATDSWHRIGFVSGDGNRSVPRQYVYTDSLRHLPAGIYFYRLNLIDLDGSSVYSNIVTVDVQMVREFQLLQNYPNPFNATTVFTFSIAKESYVSFIIYNLAGKEVTTLARQKMPAGSYKLRWNAENMSSGVYTYRLQAGSIVKVKKMILMK